MWFNSCLSKTFPIRSRAKVRLASASACPRLRRAFGRLAMPLTFSIFRCLPWHEIFFRKSFYSFYLFIILTMFKSAATRATRQFVQPAYIGRRYASGIAATFDWKDPLGSNNLFTDEELAIAETAESYCQERMLPRVLGVRAFRATSTRWLVANDHDRGIPK